MKKIFLLCWLIGFSLLTQAQLKDVLERVKQRAKEKGNQKVNTTADNAVDSAFTKTEREVKELITGDPNNKEQKGNTGNNSQPTTPGTTPVNNNNTVPNYPPPQQQIIGAAGGINAYSKYDFVPGEKIIAFEDFSTGNFGDFPSGWNTNGGGEIVTVDGKPGRWLKITRPGVLVPEFTKSYPEEFTLEFDLLHGIPFSGASFTVVAAEMESMDNLEAWHVAPHVFKTEFYITTSGQKEGSTSTEIRQHSTSLSTNQVSTELMSDQYNPVHIAIWRQKERIRIYCNQEKLWDLPKAFSPDAKLNAVLFPLASADASAAFYIGPLRLAVGAPDTRKKILEHKKWVTHGIHFDVNSATIKPESYGTLKEMANVLREYPELRVKIVGHTDSDGNDADNLLLSQNRSVSVKQVLAAEFGIDQTRMETDGKGEAEPIDKNDIPAGKANNRRVEFIKIH